jgi:D-alanyl-lipoteichoic acid acyltransferase DltB (MBOAT superfamily)
LYIPLGGSRKGKIRTYINLFITMLLGGFWHGASWNFIIWGGLHGFALTVDKLKLFIAKKLKINTANYLLKILGVFMTFHFVCFCWIFFKAATLADAKIMLNQIFNNFDAKTWTDFFANYHNVLYVMLTGFILHFIPHSVEEKVKAILSKSPLIIYLLIGLIMMGIFMQVKTAEPVMPVYLQF